MPAYPGTVRSRVTRRQLAALPSAAFAQAPAASQPDLGNLFPMLDRYAQSRSRNLSFLDPRWKRLDGWKKEARAEFARLLRFAPEAEPLGAESLGVERRDGYSVERLRISAIPGHPIPAWLLVPDGGGKRPGVIAIHCHSGRYVWGHEKILSARGDSEALLEFRDRVYGGAWAEKLVKRGVVVLVIDGHYFGEQRLRVEEMDPASAPPTFRARLQALAAIRRDAKEWQPAVDALCSEFEHLTAKTIFASGATWPGIHVWQDRRAVDYLCSRPEVDASRIGCAGLSIGGLRTAHLIAADPRIKAACVVGWMTEFHRQLRNHFRNHTWMVYVPGMYPSLDLPDAAALHAPGALLVQQCSKDQLFPLDAMRSACAKLEKIYAKAGIAERFRGSFHDLPHSFRPEMQAEAFEWLERWLRS